MNDDTIKNVLRVAIEQVQDRVTAQSQDSKEKITELGNREKFYVEISHFLRAESSAIIARGRQQENAGREFYEREISNLNSAMSKKIADVRDESMRYIGAVLAYNTTQELLKILPDTFQSEYDKAKDLQARAAAGELEKRRKPGTRPDKLKDIRNYVSNDKNESD